MRRITTVVLFLVLCTSNCTIFKPNRPVPYSPSSNFVLERPKPVQRNTTQVSPIDTVRTIIKTIYLTQTVPDRNYYSRMDSILNRRMALYADSNRAFIGSQSLVLSDYKVVLISNVKLVDSLTKVRHEKTVLKQENRKQEKIIAVSNNIDYYTATFGWCIIVLMVIFGLIKQSRIKREIIQELRATT